MGVRMARGIVEFDPCTWDRLVGDRNFYQSHGWLYALEIQHGQRGVIAAEDSSGLVGALPIWTGDEDSSELFHLPSLFDDLPGPWDGTFLWLGAHRGVSNVPVVAHGRPDVGGELLERARVEAARAGGAGVIMAYVPLDAATWLAGQHPAATAVLHSAESLLDVPPNGFAGHLARLRKRDRVKQRTDLQRFTAGNEVTWAPLAGSPLDDVVDLIAQNRARYGSDDGPAVVADAFEAQQRSGVLDRGVVARCHRDGRTVAVLVCYGFRSYLYARYFGFDYASFEPDAEYFALSYGLALDYAARQGYRRYHLATSALEVKVRRGARLVPQAAVVVPAGAPWLSATAVTAHNDRFAAWFDQTFGHRLGPTDWRRWKVTSHQ